MMGIVVAQTYINTMYTENGRQPAVQGVTHTVYDVITIV